MKEPFGDFADPHFHTNGALSVAAAADETHLSEMQLPRQNKGEDERTPAAAPVSSQMSMWR